MMEKRVCDSASKTMSERANCYWAGVYLPVLSYIYISPHTHIYRYVII